MLISMFFYRWGRQFGMISVPGRAVGDLLNIMALKGRPTTVDIYFNGNKETYKLPYEGRLNRHVEVPSNTRIFIKSDQPLSVTQLTKSKDTYQYRVSVTNTLYKCYILKSWSYFHGNKPLYCFLGIIGVFINTSSSFVIEIFLLFMTHVFKCINLHRFGLFCHRHYSHITHNF